MKPKYTMLISRSVNFYGIESYSYSVAQTLNGDLLASAVFDTRSAADDWLRNRHVAHLTRQMEAAGRQRLIERGSR